ncbi:hypothetical protein BS47DRAFT_522089 [Hydnum rufescens UP504]|uniref:Uncharacterized protein n=1 Tax=Hydnum rufescens UP504 TaxID=1448309 RepID=A0A9P6B5I2_9AGAM|nr:hypothetical protein BS47DRAFT_522089 [Hydnum rufescens UP504]
MRDSDMESFVNCDRTYDLCRTLAQPPNNSKAGPGIVHIHKELILPRGDLTASRRTSWETTAMLITFICDPFRSSRFSSGLTDSFNRGIAILFSSDGPKDDVVSNERARWRMKTPPGQIVQVRYMWMYGEMLLILGSYFMASSDSPLAPV